MTKEANTKLTKFGKAVFYFYLLLMISAACGVIVGGVSLVLKLTPMANMVLAPWWELALLMLTSWLVARLFFKECISMVDLDKHKNVIVLSKLPTPEGSGNDDAFDAPISSNVIKFRKKQDW